MAIIDKSKCPLDKGRATFHITLTNRLNYRTSAYPTSDGDRRMDGHPEIISNPLKFLLIDQIMILFLIIFI